MHARVCAQGNHPKINIYRIEDLALLATLNLGYELGYSALAFSTDGERLAVCGEEPNSTLSIYLWKQV